MNLYKTIATLHQLGLVRLASYLAEKHFPVCVPCQLSGPCPTHDTDAFLAQETDHISENSRIGYHECVACLEPERYDDHIHEDWSN